MVAGQIAGLFPGLRLALDQESLRALAVNFARIIPSVERRLETRVRVLYDQPNNHHSLPSSPFILHGAMPPPVMPAFTCRCGRQHVEISAQQSCAAERHLG